MIIAIPGREEYPSISEKYEITVVRDWDKRWTRFNIKPLQSTKSVESITPLLRAGKTRVCQQDKPIAAFSF